MIRFVLDTDLLSLYRRGSPQVLIDRIQASLRADELAITVISVEEQITGASAMLRRSRDRSQLARSYQRLAETVVFLGGFPILTFPEPAILRFEQLKAQRLNVGSMDLKIAAIAMESGAAVVTRNLRDFGRLPGLAVEDRSAGIP